MKKRYKGMSLLITVLVMATSCKKFDEINTNPLAASADQVQVDYFINNSIISAQMDPHIAERVFILYWKTAGRQQMGGGISSGGYNDGWSSDYYSSYMSGWLNAANSAIQVGNDQIAKGTNKLYTKNLIQVARIWRAYLMSELSDNFGPIPINSFQGTNPEFASVKDVYYHLLDELKDASSKLDMAVVNPDIVKKQDPAFQYDYNKWKRYANSLRLRLAMRLSEVDAAKAKAAFEEAASGELLLASDQTFKVAERGGWDALTGVMSREWN
ncbi:MAG: susd and RagB outer membrane lipoprotein domain protein, partial [Sphingobacteriia bacterium 35-40-5]